MDDGLPPLDLDRPYGIAPLARGPMPQEEYAVWLEANLWRPARDEGLEVPLDVSPTEWIGDAISPGSLELRMMVPEGFKAYARMFFPIVGEPILRDGRQVDNERLTWTEVAERNGKTAHALMEAETICSTDGGFPELGGLYNSFSEDQEAALWPILERHTGSSLGWFLLWDGFGGLDPRPFQTQPKVEHQWRAYHVLHGPMAARDRFAHPPSYIWPDDRAWCLTRDIDFYWAYIAGTAACVDALIETPVLDAYATRPSNPARSGMDLINDPNGVIPRHP